jgi:CubicO group peptidase (beta-lactamase class C family)
MRRVRLHVESAAVVSVLVLLLLLAPQRPSTAAAQGVDPFAGFDAFVEAVMKAWQIPGLSVGAIKDGKVVLAKGYGFRDVDKELPVTSRTLMAIGSNSKSFTVTLMGMLSDEKKLEWDQPVRTYLPDFALKDETATRLMTPTDLVTHRSGLPRHDQMWFAGQFSRQELYERLRHLEPNATFRQRYQYNNLMFMTAGVLVERLTNQSWDDLVKQRILTPLGMTRSNTSVRDMPQSDDASRPYVIRGGKAAPVPYRNIDAVAPAGAINSSVDEMLKYVQMHIDQGSAGGKPIVSKRFSALMQSLHSAAPISIDLEAPVYTESSPGGYGLGVSVGSYRGHKLVSHGGGIDGFISAMAWMPHDRIGVVVLTNLSGTNPVPPIVQNNVFERLLGLSLTDLVARAKEAQARNQRQAAERNKTQASQRVAGTSPSRPLAQFAGAYEHPGYGLLTVAEKDGKLSITRGTESANLVHHHYDVFREVNPDAPVAPGRTVTFGSGASGKVDTVSIPLEPAVPEIVFRRKAGP